MRSQHKNLLQKLQIYLILALGTVPVPILLCVYFANHLQNWVWVFPVLYMTLMLLCLRIPGKLRIVYGVLGFVVFLIPGFLVSNDVMGAREAFLAIGFLYGVLTVLSLQIAGWPSERELSVHVAGYCLVPHMIGQLLVLFDGARAEYLSTVAPWLTATLFIFVGLVMLSMNRSSVRSITDRRQGSSASIRGKNTLLTVALFGIALLAAVIPSVIGSVITGMAWVFDGILKFFDLLIVDTPTGPTIETVPLTTESGGMELIPSNPGDPESARITYIIMAVIAILLLTPLLIIALIRIFKALKRMLRSLGHWFQDMLANATEEGFEDEITDIREEFELGKTVKERRERLKSVFVNEQKMTAQEKIRYRYRRLATKHKDWRTGNTARENLPVQAAEIYERARYSEHIISDEDAAAFKENTKKI